MMEWKWHWAGKLRVGADGAGSEGVTADVVRVSKKEKEAPKIEG